MGAIVGGVFRGGQLAGEGIAAAVGDVGRHMSRRLHGLGETGDLTGAVRACLDAPGSDAHLQSALSRHITTVGILRRNGESDVATAGIGQLYNGIISIVGVRGGRHGAVAVTAVNLVGDVADRPAELGQEGAFGAGTALRRRGHLHGGGGFGPVRTHGHCHSEGSACTVHAHGGSHLIGINLLLIRGIGEGAVHGGHHVAGFATAASCAGRGAPRVAHADGTILRKDEFLAAADCFLNIIDSGNRFGRLSNRHGLVGHRAAFLVGDMEGHLLGQEAGDVGGGGPAGAVLPGHLAGAGLGGDAGGAFPGDGVLSVSAGNVHQHAALVVAGLRRGGGGEGQRFRFLDFNPEDG